MSDVKVAEDFMRRNLVVLTPETDVHEGVAKLLRENISGAPVVDTDGSYLGVFSEKCSMNALTRPVEIAAAVDVHIPSVREFMTTSLVTISPEEDVFEAIDHILERRISGAPVVEEEGHFLGIFSEKTAMQVLVAAIHDQFPGALVRSYMNTDTSRLIEDEDTLLDVAHKFQQTPYRRLPVLYGQKLAGQVSRRDVLNAEHRLASEVAARASRPDADPRIIDASKPGVVGDYMDTEALTSAPNTDMLTIAQLFLHSPYRRLPIVEKGQLLGQVSRRDLLEAAASMLRPKKQSHGAETLYLSPLAESAPPSLG